MIDFTGAKSIVIPEGEVAVIARGDEILWQKQKYKKELLYLESTGTQYIDTGEIINTATDEVELVFQCKESTIYKWFFGEHDNNARFGLGTGDGVNKRNVAYGNNTFKVADNQIYGDKHTFTANKNGVFLDGKKVADYKSFISSSTIYLFNLNLNGGNYSASAVIWSYKHTRNDTLIRDFIPVLDMDDKPCMYDKVGGNLFYNKGTGEFNYFDFERDYTQVEYIESTGTQYIDTGVKLTNNHSVEIDYQLTVASQKRVGIFGNLASDMSGRYGAILSPSNGYLEYGYGAGNVYHQVGLPDTKRHLFKQEKNKVYQDGSLVYTFEDAVFTINKTALFGSFDYTNYNPAKAKYYRSKWWDGDTLVRDFIPCYRNSDGAVGMFDLVTQTFFTNKGQGEFLYGAKNV